MTHLPERSPPSKLSKRTHVCGSSTAVPSSNAPLRFVISFLASPVHLRDGLTDRSDAVKSVAALRTGWTLWTDPGDIDGCTRPRLLPFLLSHLETSISSNHPLLLVYMSHPRYSKSDTAYSVTQHILGSRPLCLDSRAPISGFYLLCYPALALALVSHLSILVSW